MNTLSRLIEMLARATTDEWRVGRAELPTAVATAVRTAGQSVPGTVEYAPGQRCHLEEETGRVGRAGVKLRFVNRDGQSWEAVELQRKAEEAARKKETRR